LKQLNKLHEGIESKRNMGVLRVFEVLNVELRKVLALEGHGDQTELVIGQLAITWVHDFKNGQQVRTK
jgi:hypothetical protein